MQGSGIPRKNLIQLQSAPLVSVITVPIRGVLISIRYLENPKISDIDAEFWCQPLFHTVPCRTGLNGEVKVRRVLDGTECSTIFFNVSQ
jgi:hypothetical protein